MQLLWYRLILPGSRRLGGCRTPPLSLFSPSKLKVRTYNKTLQQNRALHRSTTHPHRHAADVELYSSTALQSALHLYSSTVLYTLHPLHPPSGHCLKSQNTLSIKISPSLSSSTRRMAHGGLFSGTRGRGAGHPRATTQEFLKSKPRKLGPGSYCTGQKSVQV